MLGYFYLHECFQCIRALNEIVHHCHASPLAAPYSVSVSCLSKMSSALYELEYAHVVSKTKTCYDSLNIYVVVVVFKLPVTSLRAMVWSVVQLEQPLNIGPI